MYIRIYTFLFTYIGHVYTKRIRYMHGDDLHADIYSM